MQKQVPTLGKLLAIIGFTFSCFGLLLYLWVSFGGPVPFQAKGYRFVASFPETAQLSNEADVRISGVSVGKVKKTELSTNGQTLVTLEIEDQYAPRPVDSKAILRQKTLLGETYIELTPGSSSKPKLPDGGRLKSAQISPSVELDEIFRSLDSKTRADYQLWLEQQALGLSGRGQDISDAIGNAAPLVEDSNELLKLLNSQQAAVRQLINDGGSLFEAVAERDSQLQSLIRSSNTVFSTTGERDQQLKEALVALPAFERETRQTARRLTEFLKTSDPLINQLRPAARELGPTATAAQQLAPDLNGLIKNLGSFIRYSKRGLPALDKTLDELEPTLKQLDPFLNNLNPMLEFVGLYRKEITAFMANVTAASQARNLASSGDDAVPLNYLRTTVPLSLEAMSAYSKRLGTNRTNPYMSPGGYLKLASGGLESYETRHCSSGPTPELSGTSNSAVTSDMVELLQKYVFDVADKAPPCTKQPLFNFSGVNTQYPQIKKVSR